MRGRKTFYLDRRNGKLLGVCAGIANYTGWDVTFVRVAMVVVTLAGLFPWSLLAYGLAGWLVRRQPLGAGADYDRPLPRATGEVRDAMREIDRRMAEVETYVASPNGRLASEIEQLR
jgi:phage shock protein C